MNKKIGVLGAGTWGMALARLLSNNGNDVTVWSALEREVKEFSETRRHPNLPGMEIPASIVFTASIEKVCTFRLREKYSPAGSRFYPGRPADS